MRIKLGDFGLAAKLENNQERRKSMCGTPNYLAPEILQNRQEGHSYEVDIWALGVIIYILIVGKAPFQTNDLNETYKRIQKCQYTIPEDLDISEPAKDIINKILVRDPSKRLSLQQILDHPFIKENLNIPILPKSAL
jgi:polo-like kinase 1